MIRDEAHSPAVQRQRQFAFRMVMPLKRNLRHASVEHTNGTALRDCNVFELGLHSLCRYLIWTWLD